MALGDGRGTQDSDQESNGHRVTDIGFTGTQRGMTLEQSCAVRFLLLGHPIIRAHHGDCVGADAFFHDIVCSLGTGIVSFDIHPCNIQSKRAYCQLSHVDACRPAKPPILRNKDIVNASDFLIACPGEKHMKIRSGTWSTIRYAQRVGKMVTIVFPDGSKVLA